MSFGKRNTCNASGADRRVRQDAQGGIADGAGLDPVETAV
jgi:hypothetical protein